MPKLHCARCGLELRSTLKAVREQGTVAMLIEPHECLENVEFELRDLKVQTKPHETTRTIEGFAFAQHLNKRNEHSKAQIEAVGFSDQRAGRTEVESTAPLGLRNQLLGPKPKLPTRGSGSEGGDPFDFSKENGEGTDSEMDG